MSADEQLRALRAKVVQRDPDQKEFVQAFDEVVTTLKPVLARRPELVKVVEQLAEPEAVHTFRVAWTDDSGELQINRGYRVQFNSAIGPYKGGLRFHQSVNLSVIKFLGFEQTFKNSLTTLPLGGGKGGSDFSPKGKSDNEVMRFCQAFMTQLYRFISPNEDVPAGDIGVGAREIGYLFGQYKAITHRHEGVLTGKGLSFGGSVLRPEATGFGAVYFLEEVLGARGDSVAGKRVVISGSGNVALHAALKVVAVGGIPLTLSDSDGYIYEKDGFDEAKLQLVFELKQQRRGRLSEYPALSPSAVYREGKRPWAEKADIAMPCATQNEVELADAERLVAGGVKVLIEGANMPTTNEAVAFLKGGGVVFGPAKAANAGGVAVSGLEMSQNSVRLAWTAEEVDTKLRGIMKEIHAACVGAAREYGLEGDLQAGSNIAGFLKVSEAMLAQGHV